MLPNNPFDSNIRFDIQESSVNNTIDQRVGINGDKIIIIKDLSEFNNSNNIRLRFDEKQGNQILHISLAKNKRSAFLLYEKQIILEEKVDEESKFIVRENNDVLTIEFDIVEDESKDETNIA